MNKRERDLLCMHIAETEWSQGGTTSEAAANNRMIESLKEIFSLTNDDLQFDRTYAMGKAVCLRNGVEMSEAWFDALYDIVAEHGYIETIDVLESETHEQFYARVEAKGSGQ